jgi:hypothetical protein
MDNKKFISLAEELYSASKDDLINLRLSIALSSFRDDVITHLISRKNEDDYLALDKYIKWTNYDVVLQIIREELNSAGWKTQLSFNDTGLFVFKDVVPKTCW